MAHRHRHELTDAQWARVEHLLPARSPTPAGPRPTTVRSSTPSSTCSRPASPGPICPVGSAGTTPPANASTAGAPMACGGGSPARPATPTWRKWNATPRRSRPTRSPRPGDAGTMKKKEDADTRRCLGRSRGGLSTKPHAAVDCRRRPPRPTAAVGAHAGPARRLPAGRASVGGPEARGTVGHVITDAAYDGDAPRRNVRRLRARCCIKPNPTRKRTKRYDRQRYRHRNVIERFFRRCRRVATRYEKKAANFAGFGLPRGLHLGGGLNVRTA